MKLTHRLVPGLVAGTLLLGTTTGVFAAKTPAPRLGVVAGQVSNLSATGFVLTASARKVAAGTAAPAASTFQVAIAATTKEIARKGTTGTLQNGDYAVVVGARSATAVAARRILFSTTPFKGKTIRAVAQKVVAARVYRAAGTVAPTTTASTLVITTKAGKTLTFSITSATKFRVNKQLVATAPVLIAGQRVIVLYSHDKTTTTTLDARAVKVRPVKTGAPAATQP